MDRKTAPGLLLSMLAIILLVVAKVVLVDALN
jgi:hypothetical protein